MMEIKNLLSIKIYNVALFNQTLVNAIWEAPETKLSEKSKKIWLDLMAQLPYLPEIKIAHPLLDVVRNKRASE